VSAPDVPLTRGTYEYRALLSCDSKSRTIIARNLYGRVRIVQEEISGRGDFSVDFSLLKYVVDGYSHNNS
jgi:hypothetical protein